MWKGWPGWNVPRPTAKMKGTSPVEPHAADLLKDPHLRPVLLHAMAAILLHNWNVFAGAAETDAEEMGGREMRWGWRYADPFSFNRKKKLYFMFLLRLIIDFILSALAIIKLRMNRIDFTWGLGSWACCYGPPDEISSGGLDTLPRARLPLWFLSTSTLAWLSGVFIFFINMPRWVSYWCIWSIHTCYALMLSRLFINAFNLKEPHWHAWCVSLRV